MVKMLDLAQPVEPALATTAGAALYQRFEREPDVLAIAVVDLSGRPVGIVERNSFFLRMAAEYGRALYAQRPVAVLMNSEPVIVDEKVSLSTFTGEALAERPSELMHGSSSFATAFISASAAPWAFCRRPAAPTGRTPWK
jgi:hypothetical protein